MLEVEMCDCGIKTKNIYPNWSVKLQERERDYAYTCHGVCMEVSICLVPHGFLGLDSDWLLFFVSSVFIHGGPLPDLRYNILYLESRT